MTEYKVPVVFGVVCAAGFVLYQCVTWSYPEMTWRQLFMEKPIPMILSQVLILVGFIGVYKWMKK